MELFDSRRDRSPRNCDASIVASSPEIVPRFIWKLSPCDREWIGQANSKHTYRIFHQDNPNLESSLIRIDPMRGKIFFLDVDRSDVSPVFEEKGYNLKWVTIYDDELWREFYIDKELALD